MKMNPWVCFIIGLSIARVGVAADTVIAVAANFTAAGDEIATRFERATGHRIKVSYGSTGKLYSQIDNGAPFDVFLAADQAHPARAEAEGLAVTGTRFTYARGYLVLWSAYDKLFDNGKIYLQRAEISRLAIANPLTSPYGQAAREVMEELGVWAALQPRLVRGDSIAQTFQFVATRNAPAGFVALSQIRAWTGKDGTLWNIPQHYYTPITQQAVLLKHGKDNPAAKAFLDFLRGVEARAVITRYGYTTE